MDRINLEVIRGSTPVYELTIVDENDVAIDITDYTIYLIVKTKKADSDATAVLSISVTSHTDAINGKTEIALTKTQTNLFTVGQYWYSIEYNDGESGADLDEDVLMEGKLTVLRPTRIG